MVLMVVCGVLATMGVAGAVRWGGLGVRPPWGGDVPAVVPAPTLAPGLVLRRYLWYLDLAVVSAIGSGLLVAGAGGRLVMRLLAVTAGPGAQGRLTEAEEVVGEITVGGTVGFLLFVGLFSGLAASALFLLLRRWLPTGRLCGLAFGLLLLVVAATRIEPLRADNPDFGIVGPGWLALVAFSAVVVVQGMLVAALAARLSRALPLLSRRRRTWLSHAPLILLVPLAAAGIVLAVIGGLVVAVNSRWPVAGWLSSASATKVGRALVLVAAVVALPGFVATVVEIAG